jgi:hypothetical protein
MDGVNGANLGGGCGALAGKGAMLRTIGSGGSTGPNSGFLR